MEIVGAITRKPLLLVPLLCYLLALVTLLAGAKTAYHSVSSETWPTAPGVVISSKEANAKTKSFWSSEPRARVRYSYTVTGEQYSSDPAESVYFNQKNASEADVTRILSNYPAGKKVTVYYDPEEPSRSILEPEIHDELWDALWGFLGFAAVGFFLHALFWKLSWL